MTAGELEVSFETSARDWIRVQSVLNGMALRRQNLPAYLLTYKGLMTWVLRAVMFALGIFILVTTLPMLLAGDLIESFSAATALSLVLVGTVFWTLGWALWNLVMQKPSPFRSLGRGREGVHWGRHRVLATTDSLSVCLSDCRTIYSWNAVVGLNKTKDLLLLELTPRFAIAIPRRAFASAAEERDFCDFVRARISS